MPKSLGPSLDQHVGAARCNEVGTGRARFQYVEVVSSGAGPHPPRGRNHALVLSDAIKAPDRYDDEYDFGTLLADESAKIEVLRGQQSSLYGSTPLAA